MRYEAYKCDEYVSWIASKTSTIKETLYKLVFYYKLDSNETPKRRKKYSPKKELQKKVKEN